MAVVGIAWFPFVVVVTARLYGDALTIHPGVRRAQPFNRGESCRPAVSLIRLRPYRLSFSLTVSAVEPSLAVTCPRLGFTGADAPQRLQDNSHPPTPPRYPP